MPKKRDEPGLFAEQSTGDGKGMAPVGLKIVRLRAENVKKLVAVDLRPDGETIVIGGENGAGKSSVLDAIWYLLGGKDAQPPEPLRRGAEKGSVEADLGDLIARRTFTAGGGGSLTVKNRDGATYPSPQAILDRLVGDLSFDPLAFTRMPAKEQLDLLRRLTGIDFSDLDARRAELYQERTAAARELRQEEAQLAGMPEVEAPAEEVSVAELTGQLLASQGVARANDIERRKAGGARDLANLAANSVRDADTKVEELLEELKQAEAEAEAARRVHLSRQEEADRAAKSVAALVDPDLVPIEAALRGAEEVNRRVRAAAARAQIIGWVETKRARVDDLTASIAAVDAEKEAKLADAPFPVPGLGFGEDGVLLCGLPFEQASATEQLMVSLAMGAALNPRLRVLLVKDASLLTPKSRATLLAWCAEKDMQGWIELAGEGPECSVVIEDGSVRGAIPDEALGLSTQGVAGEGR